MDGKLRFRIMAMCKILSGTLLVLFALACEGPEGPPGIPAIQAQVVEVGGIDFTYDNSSNIHRTLITFSSITDFVVFESDAVLVYRLEDEIPVSGDDPIRIWSQLPQNFFFGQDIFQYIFTHTFEDVELLIEGNFDLSGLGPEFTQNQVFRIVFVPGEFNPFGLVTPAFLSSVMTSLDIQENEVKQLIID